MTCLVSDHPGWRDSHFQTGIMQVGGSPGRAVVTGTQVWRQDLKTISVQGTNRGKWIWEENSLLSVSLVQYTQGHAPQNELAEQLGG